MTTFANAPTRLRTSLAQTAIEQHLDRILCASCLGYGADILSLECDFCTPERWCDSHRCRICNGLGVCCPRCKGMRWLRTGNPGHMVAQKEQQHERANPAGYGTLTGHSMVNSALHKCGMCHELQGEKLVYNAAKELDAIRLYIRYPDGIEWQQRAKAQAAQTQAEERYRFINGYLAKFRKAWQWKPEKIWQAIREQAVTKWEEYQATKASNAVATEETPRNEVGA